MFFFPTKSGLICKFIDHGKVLEECLQNKAKPVFVEYHFKILSE